MISRLVVFGCSITYGHGLSDCWDEETGHHGPLPSNLVWGKKLADRLGVNIVNNGFPGASNIYITNKIINFDFLPNDFVINCWTSPFRSTVFNEKEPHWALGSWNQEEHVKSYFHLHHDHSLKHQSLLNIHHASLHLDSLNIKYINTCFKYYNIKNLNTGKLKIKNFLEIPCLDNHLDKAIDGSHPGMETQNEICSVLYDEVKKHVR